VGKNGTVAAASLCYRDADGAGLSDSMATCPHCKGYLSDGHRCPRRRGSVAAEIIASGIVGALASYLLLAAFDPRGQATDMDLIAIVAGAAVAIGLNRLLRS
jgi:uncharacterized membrane protein YeaQ/YmgE (transglycosylase-associated protein family)